MAWQIKFTETATKQLVKLDQQTQREILQYLKEKNGTDEDPRRFGASLRRELAGRWKYRIGSYRLICEIQDDVVVVLVLMVGHRSKIYVGH